MVWCVELCLLGNIDVSVDMGVSNNQGYTMVLQGHPQKGHSICRNSPMVAAKNFRLDPYIFNISNICNICIYIYTWQRLKNIRLVTGPGGLFATRPVTESGGLAPDPATRVCSRGPATKVCNRGGRGGEPRQTPISKHSHIYTLQS